MGIAAVGAVAVGGSLYAANKSASAQKSAAKNASQAQSQSADAAIQEQRRQFDAVQKLLSPYVIAGTGALGQQQNILGINGAKRQASAISAIEKSPYFQATAKQGENAILQNASATGGLRGGNTQAALGQFRPGLLNQLVQQQYQNLGGLTSMGQNSAVQQGNAGMQSANSIGNLLGQQGQAQAGNALAQGQANANMYNAYGNAFGQIGGLIAGGF